MPPRQTPYFIDAIDVAVCRQPAAAGYAMFTTLISSLIATLMPGHIRRYAQLRYAITLTPD